MGLLKSHADVHGMFPREVGDAVAKHIPDTSMEEHGRRDNERVVRLP